MFAWDGEEEVWVHITEDDERTVKRVFIVSPLGEVEVEFRKARFREYATWGLTGVAVGAGVGAVAAIGAAAAASAPVTVPVVVTGVGVGALAGGAVGVAIAPVKRLRARLGWRRKRSAQAPDFAMSPEAVAA